MGYVIISNPNGQRPEVLGDVPPHKWQEVYGVPFGFCHPPAPVLRTATTSRAMDAALKAIAVQGRVWRSRLVKDRARALAAHPWQRAMISPPLEFAGWQEAMAIGRAILARDKRDQPIQRGLMPPVIATNARAIILLARALRRAEWRASLIGEAL